MIQITELNKTECVGCGACTKCPQGCISMQEDTEGFLYPVVDASKCIGCGLCDNSCPVKRTDDSESKSVDYQAFGGYCVDENIRSDSSSGGAFSMLASWILDKQGVVFGCELNKDMKAVHVGISSIDDLHRLRGSKYVQSEIGNTFYEVETLLKQDKYVLFVGTPCQIGGLKGFLNAEYEKLYTCDFICHGVPSPKVFKKYLDDIKANKKSDIVEFRFRNKDTGWNQSGMQQGTLVKFADGGSVRKHPAYKDSYMNGFLSDITLRPSCYECRFKHDFNCVSDITIADFWGVDSVKPQLNDGCGTSLVIVGTQKGQKLFNASREDLGKFEEVDYKAATKKNATVRQSAKKSVLRKSFFKKLDKYSYSRLKRGYLSSFVWVIKKVFDIFFSKQFLKFGLVGITNSAVSYGINVLTLLALKNMNLKFDYVIANFMAFGLSVLWSYNLNSRLVFKLSEGESRETGKTLLKTYASYAFSGIVLNNLLGTLWIQVLGIPKFISPLLNLIITVPTNFILNKFWAYKNSSE